MLATDVQPYINGIPVSTVAAWGDLKWSERLAGGCWEASWQMEVPAGWHHPLVRAGALVELKLGSWPIWAGTLTEPDRDSWTMTAQGLSRIAEHYSALDWPGQATTDATIAAYHAITVRQMPWANLAGEWAGLPAASGDGTSQGINTVAAVLDAVADEAGMFWGVGPDRIAYIVGRPTSPSWRVVPGAGVLGVADDEFVTHLIGRYRSGASTLATRTVGDNGTPGTPSYRWGRREEVVDLTPRGVITAAKADSILAGMLSKVGPRPGYSNGLDLGRYEITTAGGSHACLPLIRAGDGVRLHGVVDDSLTPLPYHDITIGEIRHEAESNSVYIEPLGLAARNLAAVLEGSDDIGLVA